MHRQSTMRTRASRVNTNKGKQSQRGVDTSTRFRTDLVQASHPKVAHIAVPGTCALLVVPALKGAGCNCLPELQVSSRHLSTAAERAGNTQEGQSTRAHRHTNNKLTSAQMHSMNRRRVCSQSGKEKDNKNKHRQIVGQWKTLTLSFTLSFTHSLSHSLSHSVSLSLTHSLTLSHTLAEL